jgi:hypothetical protein
MTVDELIEGLQKYKGMLVVKSSALDMQCDFLEMTTLEDNTPPKWEVTIVLARGP